MSRLFLLLLIAFPNLISSVDEKIADEKEAQLYLKDVDKINAEKSSVMAFTQWNFNTDINDQNENKVVSLSNQNLKLYIILFYHSISYCQ
jgi:hypothetical protein